ncbi:MAG: hypothetical protein KJ587_00710 [Alphaproteobacteria bacterium]|nr:hypothetical protein [Alphaproteobacteria bacterium]
MPADNSAQSHHERFLREQHEKQLTNTAISANAAAAELIAEKIAAKLAEQNDIIYRIGQRQGRTSFIAYLSLLIAATAAVGQLLGPVWEWPVLRGML